MSKSHAALSSPQVVDLVLYLSTGDLDHGTRRLSLVLRTAGRPVGYTRCMFCIDEHRYELYVSHEGCVHALLITWNLVVAILQMRKACLLSQRPSFVRRRSLQAHERMSRVAVLIIVD